MYKQCFQYSEALFFQAFCVNTFTANNSQGRGWGKSISQNRVERSSPYHQFLLQKDDETGRLACNYLPHPAQAGDQVPGGWGEGKGGRFLRSGEKEAYRAHGRRGRGAAHLSWPVDATPGPAVETTVESRAGTIVVGGPGTVSGSWETPVCCADAWSVGSFWDHLKVSDVQQRAWESIWRVYKNQNNNEHGAYLDLSSSKQGLI